VYVCLFREFLFANFQFGASLLSPVYSHARVDVLSVTPLFEIAVSNRSDLYQLLRISKVEMYGFGLMLLS
jgi:hypothetical protein